MTTPIDDLSALGLRTPADLAPARTDNNRLGQEEFLNLMVAQLRNQDPFKPMENGDFIAQMAQFGTVSGIEGLQQSFDNLSGQLVSQQALQAASLVGREVLAPTGVGQLEEGGMLHGQIQLDQPAGEVNVNVYDASGQLVRRLPLGSQGEGSVAFNWDGLKDDGSYAPPGTYLVGAEASYNGEPTAVEAYVAAEVQGVTLSRNGGLTLDLAGVGPIAFEQVRTIQ